MNEYKWISIKEQIPPCADSGELPYCLALHTVHGVGVAWFSKFTDIEIAELEEECGDKYICSAHFIMNKLDANFLVDNEDDIDIFKNSPDFKNLGTISHWMLLPNPPSQEHMTRRYRHFSNKNLYLLL